MGRWLATGVFSFLAGCLTAIGVCALLGGERGFGTGIVFGLPLGSVAGAGILGKWLLRFSPLTLLIGTVLALGLSLAGAFAAAYAIDNVRGLGWLMIFGPCFGTLAGYAIAKKIVQRSPRPVA